ncbi:MAG: hypothetical protein OXR66_01455 [Candidatus Woesearchaeota archaeon]|nr:hypothetical protein [Candidatus Woesearchaeota archaeon]
MSKNILLCLGTVLLLLGVLELTAGFLVHKDTTIEVTPLFNVAHDEHLGYTLHKNAAHTATLAREDGSICYNVTYTTDEHGRRIVPQTEGEQHLLIFGGSVAYGQGLQDQDTLQYHLARHLPAIVSNYAVHGYGPSHALAQIDAGVPASDAALFFFIPAHVNRVVGNTLAWWLYDSPYYYLVNDELRRDGSFRTGRPVRTRVYERFLWVKERSNFLQVANVNLPLWATKDDVEVTAAVLAAAKVSYEAQTNGTFIVVFHPEWNRTQDKRGYTAFTHAFAAHNVTVLDYSDYPYTDDKIIPCDNHPNGVLNKELAALIADDPLVLSLKKDS